MNITMSNTRVQRVVILTSEVIVLNSSHINRGKMFFKNVRLISDSTISSSASRGCRGKDAAEVLQVFMAQVRKLRVRSFIFGRVLICLILRRFWVGRRAWS